jgi:UDP-N-acetylmuramate: L-alanyl-gamma-D-glutamyl-meso-diaminopimelate ligase
VITYGRAHNADWRIESVDFGSGEVSFQLRDPGTSREETFRSPLPGTYNVWNLTAVIAAASIAGMTIESIREAAWTFGGVKRRQDVVGEFAGVLVVDDFAHHPTSVAETLAGLRLFYPERRIIAAFEPRSNSSRRNVFQERYAQSFPSADIICIKQPPAMGSIAEPERLDARRLVDDIRKDGLNAFFFQTTDELLGFVLKSARARDLIVCMSNGSFDGLTQRLALELASRSSV